MKTTNETDIGILQSIVEALSKRLETLENLIYAAKDILSLEEAAKFLDLSRSTLYKMTHNNEIPFYKPNNKKLYFEKSELLTWIRRCRVCSAEEAQEKAQAIIRDISQKSL